MAVTYIQESGLFTLDTKNTTYQMKVNSHGFLLHLYYGKKLRNDSMEYLVLSRDRGFSGNPYEVGQDKTFSLDTVPQEYASFGIGDYRIGCIEVVNGDGSQALDLRYTGYKIKQGKYKVNGMPALYENQADEAETLELYMEDAHTGIEVTLYYGIFEELDMITRSVEITNRGSDTIKLEKIMSTCLDFIYGDWDFIHFHGRHSMEREMERSSVIHGVQSIGSLRGISSHQHNPFMILCDKETTEDYGSCYGMSLLYSGNFIASVEGDSIGQVRMVMGIHPNLFSFGLESGDSFQAPEVAMTYSDQGLNVLSRNYHKAYRNHLCRGEYKLKKRPVLINNWEATYFDFDSKKIIAITKNAAEIGIDMLVMDDGWFGKREDDHSSLGDWFVNLEKLQGGLKPLVDEVNQLGLKFGIWVEPEMISEDSDLYRKHPEWALQIPKRNPTRSRHQLVLDFSREDVREYIFDSLVAVLDSANIEYVKWDMNRALSDLYSNDLPMDRQGELSHRYVLGLYDFLEKITSRYPHILFEGCSGGGGRFDAGMLYYHPQIWCSDNTDAVERLKIQYGTSFGYPISTVCSHVSASPNHQTGRATTLKTRGVVAMSGSFGYELDLNQMPDEDKAIAREQVMLYKKYQGLIYDGDYYRLSNPYENRSYTAWQHVGQDRKASLVCVVATSIEGNALILYVKLKGLDSEKIYSVDGKQRLSGSALMNGGLGVMSITKEYEAVQFYLEEV